MAATEGGSSRFGALAEVLNGKLSKRWKMFTPPYCLLLIRAFLTLEGIAAQLELCGAIDRKLMPAHREPPPPNPDGPVSLSAKGGAQISSATSPQSRRLAARQRKWQRKVARFLVAYHLRTQLAGGLRGVATLAKLAWLGASPGSAVRQLVRSRSAGKRALLESRFAPAPPKASVANASAVPAPRASAAR
ncbi:hypothetical protein JL720_15724 [Aureococcus anophagefferens]|nr:hypothetical protein JL720_15724 [Aureococcus anophagefferens]